MPIPYVVAEERDYIVAFKPKGMHGAPLSEGEEGTLLAWCASSYPEVTRIRGRKPIEGGLLHRLDRETEGIMVLARNQATYDALAQQQESGSFVKEYRAICVDLRAAPDDAPDWPPAGFPSAPIVGAAPFLIQSAFRPFGPGRRAVRPSVPGPEAGSPRSPGRRARDIARDRGEPYRTEVLEIARLGGTRFLVRSRLARGFRHQIRCHLAWISLPIAGDRLYGRECDGEGGLALSAVAVAFLDPVAARPVRYECPPSPEPEGTP